jgi:hypothetical protein
MSIATVVVSAVKSSAFDNFSLLSSLLQALSKFSFDKSFKA